MPTKAGVPSCIRVPPELGAAKTGSSSRLARSKASDDALGGHRPDRPGEEPELAGDDGDAAPADAALARDDRLVAPAPLGGGSQLGGIRLPGSAGCDRDGVPAQPRAVVEDGVEQLAGAEALSVCHGDPSSQCDVRLSRS